MSKKRDLQEYKPSKKILENYAKVMIDFALGSTKGIKKGDVVYLSAPMCAVDLFVACRNRIIERGGHVIGDIMLNDQDRRMRETPDFFARAKKHQIEFSPNKYIDGLIDQVDHYLVILAKENMHSFKDINPQLMMRKQQHALGYLFKKRQDKEMRGELTWSLCLYPSQALAKESGMSLKEYWSQVEKACFLREKDPVAKWKETVRSLEKHRKALNRVTAQTERFHVHGPEVDLWITPGPGRQWLGGTGSNIPSFEIFTSPDCRYTEGWIKFNQPLYFSGSVIEGVELWFEKGHVVKSRATKNQKLLQEMLSVRNADVVGEFSLTDRRYSKITKFMAETLYDENVGGRYGNTHIAVGNSYLDTYAGDKKPRNQKQYESLGYNFSAVHTDIMSTTDRTVTAYLKNGKTKVIYQDGMYMV